MNEGIWSFWARHYDRLWVQRVSLRPTREQVCTALPPGAALRLLDVGCGTGQLLGDLRRQPHLSRLDYTGFDAAPGMIAEARRKFPSDRFVVSTLDGFDSPEAPWDAVVCSHAFPYMPDAARAMDQLFSLLRPGGMLLLSQACTETAYDRLVLPLVKLTTSRAVYLGEEDLCRLAAPYAAGPPRIEPIHPRRAMPTLRLFIWQRRKAT